MRIAKSSPVFSVLMNIDTPCRPGRYFFSRWVIICTESGKSVRKCLDIYNRRAAGNCVNGYEVAMQISTVLAMVGRGAVAGFLVVAAAEIAGRFPRLGALILTLPLVVPIVFLTMYMKTADVAPI